MQAVILAGGRGIRLGHLTDRLPKPMAPVAGAPYLEHQLRLLAQQSILDIVILTGYLGNQIEQYFGSGARLRVSIRYSREERPLGTGGALRNAHSLLEDEFLVLYGDSYLPIDYWPAVRLLRQRCCEGLMVVYNNRHGDTSVRNNVALDEDAYVVSYDKSGKPGSGVSHVDAGVLAFRRSVVELISPAATVSLEQEVFPQLIARRQLCAFETVQRFYDIGTPDRLQALEEWMRA